MVKLKDFLAILVDTQEIAIQTDNINDDTTINNKLCTEINYKEALIDIDNFMECEIIEIMSLEYARGDYISITIKAPESEVKNE